MSAATTPASTLRFAAASTFLVATLDLLQPLLLPWRPKFFAAIAGAILYFLLSLAIGIRGHRIALGIAALMPIIPLSAIVGRLVGLPLPFDLASIGVFVVQLAAAGFASLSLRR